MGYSPWDHKELDTTERLTLSFKHNFGKYVLLSFILLQVSNIHKSKENSVGNT